MRKLNWVARGLLVCLFMGAEVLAQAQDPPAPIRNPPNIQLITPGTITRGDEITITGTNLSKSGARTVVMIDGKEADQVEVVKDSVEIKALVESGPLLKNQQRAGEYTRVVVVKVGEQISNTYTLRHLTWGAIRTPQVWVAIVLYLALVVAITLGVKASVIKSATGQPSLSKIQMGVWTFVFGLAYILLAAIWKEFLDISEGMFWLMGISATTAVGAKAIVLKNLGKLDRDHPSTLLKDYDKTSGSFEMGKQSFEELRSEGIPDNILKQLEGIKDKEFVGEEEFLRIVKTTIGDAQTDQYKSKILKHAGGYKLSLHRCQIAIWTLIVLIIYLVELVDTMRLPEIPDKLLLLMGISGGTYLGFNYPKPSP